MIWFAEFENTQCGKVKKDMLNTRTTLSLAGSSRGQFTNLMRRTILMVWLAELKTHNLEKWSMTLSLAGDQDVTTYQSRISSPQIVLGTWQKK